MSRPGIERMICLTSLLDLPHGCAEYIYIICTRLVYTTDTVPLGYGSVKPGKNSIFLKNGKTVISVENRKFSRSRMTKWIAP